MSKYYIRSWKEYDCPVLFFWLIRLMNHFDCWYFRWYWKILLCDIAVNPNLAWARFHVKPEMALCLAILVSPRSIQSIKNLLNNKKHLKFVKKMIKSDTSFFDSKKYGRILYEFCGLNDDDVLVFREKSSFYHG